MAHAANLVRFSSVPNFQAVWLKTQHNCCTHDDAYITACNT